MNQADEKIADGNYFTEDVSLNKFMQHLIKMVVQNWLKRDDSYTYKL